MNKTVLCIIDGLGINPDEFGNAAKAADMKNLDSIMRDFPSTQIKASGLEVGLADDKDPGNSEVGHNAIGAGQHIKQGLALLNEQFESGNIFRTLQWEALRRTARATKLNVINLLSDGRLHSDMYKHLFPLLEKCAQEHIKVAIHGCLDGRDVPTQSAMKYINDIREHIEKVGAEAKIATVAGRSILWMDRYETNLKLLSDAVEVCALGNGTITEDIEKAINDEYAANPTMTDETMPAFILEPDWLINNGDAVLLLNYRGDRAVEICSMFEMGAYLTPEQYEAINKCKFTGVLQYDAEKRLPAAYLCPPPEIRNTLTQWLIKHNARQYSVTETVKFGHLTYYFNGNRARPYDASLEIWKEFKSDVCANMYNGAPKMQAELITDDVIEAVKSSRYDFIKLNLPNPDMVGHTGDFDATVIACKTVDDCVGKLVECCREQKVNLIVTADHGSAEFMKYPDGKPMSAHTNSPIPFVVLPFGSCARIQINKGEFGLTNLAATICLLMGIPVAPWFNQSIIDIAFKLI